MRLQKQSRLRLLLRLLQEDSEGLKVLQILKTVMDYQPLRGEIVQRGLHEYLLNIVYVLYPAQVLHDKHFLLLVDVAHGSDDLPLDNVLKLRSGELQLVRCVL